MKCWCAGVVPGDPSYAGLLGRWVCQGAGVEWPTPRPLVTIFWPPNGSKTLNFGTGAGVGWPWGAAHLGASPWELCQPQGTDPRGRGAGAAPMAPWEEDVAPGAAAQGAGVSGLVGPCPWAGHMPAL